MKLELSEEDARFLHAQLVRHTREVELELARTDKREMQRALADDLARMQRVVGSLDQSLRELESRSEPRSVR
jgi:hypothetical protein